MTGLLVPMANVPAMADAICRLLEDTSSARNMGVQGRKRAVEDLRLNEVLRN